MKNLRTARGITWMAISWAGVNTAHHLIAGNTWLTLMHGSVTVKAKVIMSGGLQHPYPGKNFLIKARFLLWSKNKVRMRYPNAKVRNHAWKEAGAYLAITWKPKP